MVQRAVSVSKILAEDAGWGFNSFLSDNDYSPAIDAKGQENCRKPKFTLREFVRLIYIIGMDADAGDAYGETGQSMPPEQLDVKITYDYLWTTTIADRFNSAQVRPRGSHGYLYSGLDPGPTPLEVREGSNLKSLWTEFRKDFTEWNRRYNQSGQNSPDFKRFIQESKSRGAPDVNSARVCEAFGRVPHHGYEG